MNSEDFAMKILGVAALVPQIANWLRDAAADRDDNVSKRVRDILPEKSESEKALEAYRANGSTRY